MMVFICMRQQKRKNGDYKHDLRNYVYYSEQIKEDNIDIIIRYTLDNYIAVSGTIDGDYITRAGYLINLADLSSTIKDIDMESVTGITYKGVTIGTEEVEEYTGPYDEEETNKKYDNEDKTAIAYYKEAYEFTDWFLNTVKIGNIRDYLKIGENNDPEDESSVFVQHKRQIMKEKIEETLNSSITAYANKTGNNYKMPKFTEEDWEKVYSNISVISFVQGMSIGFKNYNNYCILNSTNNQEYVNPNLIYFTDRNSYHDIRCSEIEDEKTTGYKIGSFEKQSYEYEEEVEDDDGNVTTETKTEYYYKHNELACYECVNGSLTTNKDEVQSIYDYVRDDNTSDEVKMSYFSALARERYNTTKLLNSYNAEYTQKCTITYEPGDTNGTDVTDMPNSQNVNVGETIQLSSEPKATGFVFVGWMVNGREDKIIPTGGTYKFFGDTTLVAKWKVSTITINIYDVDTKEFLKEIQFDPNNPDTYMNRRWAGFENGHIIWEYTTEKKISVNSKPGYTLQGIYDNKECEGTDYNGKGYTFVTNSLDLYAKYTVNTYTITYHYPDEVVVTEPIEYGATTTIEEAPSYSDGEYFITWSTSTTSIVEYTPGQVINVYSNMNLYPIAIKLDDLSLKYQYYTGSIWSTFYLSNENYTNKERIRIVSSRTLDKYLKFYINNVEIDENGKEYVTQEDTINEFNISYKFEIFNVEGKKIAEKTGTKYIMVDRKPPVISNFRKNSKFGGTTGYIYVDVTDEGSGISGVRTNWFSLFTTEMNVDENGYTYWKWADAIHNYESGTITATDKAGNPTSYSY